MSDHWNGDGERMTDSERGRARESESEQVRGRASEEEDQSGPASAASGDGRWPR
jgi:hypothetical protein